MSGSRIKNLILLVLTASALCLLLVVVPNRMAQIHEQRQMLEQLRTLYGGYGISLELDELPRSATLYSVELGGEQQTAVQALLGQKAVMTSDPDRFETEYSSELGTLQLTRTGGFSAVLTGSKRAGQPEAAARKLLRSMGFQAASVQQLQQADGTAVVQAGQSLLGVPVFGSMLQLTYRQEQLVQLEGTFYLGSESITRVSEQQSISCADALTQLLASRDVLGWVGESVRQLTQGYLPTETAASGIRFVPVWYIETDSGSFYVNAITREISAV